MKTNMLLALCVVLLVTVSCMPPMPRAIIKPDSPAKNEVIMTQELKSLLAENPRPKLVVRVSNPPANITEAEKFNAYINVIEKTLMQNGFIVRDRALLENLMRTGNVDYKMIGEKIDTDIILDVLSLQFGVPNHMTTYLNLATNQKESFRHPDNYVDCQHAKLECRLTVVKKGELGGMFTFFVSRCDVQDLEFFVNRRYGLMRWVDNPGIKTFRALSAPIESEEVKNYCVVYLSYNLINQLLEGVNSQSRRIVELYKEESYAEAQALLSDLIKKDPRNFLLYVYQALIYAKKGSFPKAQNELENALQKADIQYQKATVYYGYAMVYALKGEKSLAISFLRKGLSNGLANFIKLKEIRTNPDLASISSSSEFESLLGEYEQPVTGKK